MPLLVVAHADNIQLWSISLPLRLLKADAEFLWWGGGAVVVKWWWDGSGVVCKVIFGSNPAIFEVGLGCC